MLTNHLKIIQYITDMAKQMNQMAHQAQSPFLALLLDMVVEEGQDIIKNAETCEDDSNATETRSHQSVE